MKAHILIVDDEELIRWSLCADLSAAGFKTASAAGVGEAIAMLERVSPDLVLTDLRLGEESRLDLLRKVRDSRPEVPVLLMTAFAEVSSAVEALREGAADYILKPLQLDALKVTLNRVLETSVLRRRAAESHRRQIGRYSFGSIVASSALMRKAVADACKMAASPDSNILLLGESGCGKDLMARAIHYESARGVEPFMEISCTAIPENLLESELFGHEKGAFTGAVGLKRGLFEIAAPGTVFLNEIGHMPPGLQAKLLRVIEDKTFKRVGGREDLSVDVRVIAATNEDLEKAVTEKRFRADLYYRLNVLTVRLPPLRERPEDIAPLIESLLGRLSRDLRKPKPVLSEETRKSLLAYAWPGNVRELRNVLERMMILGEESAGLPASPAGAQAAPRGSGGFPLPEGGVELDGLEKDLVRQALERSGGNQQQAGRLLGISRDALRRRIEKFGLK